MGWSEKHELDVLPEGRSDGWKCSCGAGSFDYEGRTNTDVIYDATEHIFKTSSSYEEGGRDVAQG